jgi:hypothetical protein
MPISVSEKPLDIFTLFPVILVGCLAVTFRASLEFSFKKSQSFLFDVVQSPGGWDVGFYGHEICQR